MESPRLNEKGIELEGEQLSTEKGHSGGISEEKAGVRTQEFNETLIAEKRNEVNRVYKDTQPEITEVAEVQPGGFEGDLEIFNKFPEVHEHLTKLLNKISGENQKGLNKVTSFFSRSYNNDVLELAIKGAKTVKGKMEVYKEALEQGGPDLAWEYIQASGQNPYLYIEDGQIVKNSISRSTEFSGKSDLTINAKKDK